MEERKKFRNLMNVMDLNGFYLIANKKITNGHVLTVGIPPTGTFSDFEKKKEQLENYFRGIIELEKTRFSSSLQVKIITKDVGNYLYEPTRPNKYSSLFVGKKFDGEPYFIDLNKDAHILIAGKTGTGKSFLLATILTNLIYHHNKQYDIYLCQTNKRDIDYLKNCKGIKASLYTAKETATMLDKAVKEINTRAEYFARVGAKGLDHYNKVTNKRLKRKIFVFEEISLYMTDVTDTTEEKKYKTQVWSNVWKIVKLGREVGIHFIGLSQRTTAANLGGSGEIKSQLCRITFKQSQELDSRNCIDSDLAITLSDRECYILGNDGLILVKVPTTDKEMKLLQKYVPEIITVATVGQAPKKQIKLIRRTIERFDKYSDTPTTHQNGSGSREFLGNKDIEKAKTGYKKSKLGAKKGVILEDVAVAEER